MLPNDLAIERLPLDQIKPSPHHARVHNRAQSRKLKNLLRRFGVVAPILIGPSNEIVDGHLVHEVAKDLGLEDLPVVRVVNRTPEEIRALRLALNRLPQDSGWDRPKLREELSELLALGFEMKLTGFDAVEIDMTLDVDPAPANSVDEVEFGEIDPAVELGDIWRLGVHTVVCGDSTNPEIFPRFCGELKASVVFTDPPYNVRIRGFVSGLGKANHREFAQGAGEMSPAEFTAFLTSFIAAMVPVLAGGSIIFICMDWRHMRELMDAAAANGLEHKNLIVWVKTNGGMGTFYRSQHELLFAFKHGEAPHQNHFELGQHGRSRTNVWTYRGVNAFGPDRSEQIEGHPTCKPVAMIEDALRDVSQRGQIVLEPFLGSGSTLLAAETTGRVCIGIELDPAYVELTIRRWQRLTKRDATHYETGETFDAFCERKRAEASHESGPVADAHDGADEQ